MLYVVVCMRVSVCVHRSVDGAYLSIMHLVYPYVSTKIHAHRRELKERKFRTGFQTDIIQLFHEMSVSPKSSRGLSYLSNLESFTVQSPHIRVTDEGQAHCLALRTLMTAL